MPPAQGSAVVNRTRPSLPVLLLACCIALTTAAGSAAATTMSEQSQSSVAGAVERIAVPEAAPQPAPAAAPVEAAPAVAPAVAPAPASAVAVAQAPAAPAPKPAKAPKPAPTPKQAPTPAAAPAQAAPAPQPAPQPAPPPAPTGPTSWPELNAAISRIASYDGSATWVVSDQYGQWGTADWYRDTIYIAPGVPHNRLDDVVVHEWSHLLSVRPYSDPHAAVAAMNEWFGGTDLTGAERAADCMAILQGARWTRYTSCEDPHWRDGARRLLSGQRLA